MAGAAGEKLDRGAACTEGRGAGSLPGTQWGATERIFLGEGEGDNIY